MNKKQIIGIILAVVSVVGFCGMTKIEDKTALIIGSALLLIAGAVVFYLGLKEKSADNSSVNQPVQSTNGLTSCTRDSTTLRSPAVDRQTKAVDGTRDVDMLPLCQGDLIKVYQYKEKLCIIRGTDPLPHVIDAVNKGNRQIIFEFEPDNEFDSNAVKVMLEGEKIGYVYRGTTQDMIHDFFEGGFEVAAHINTFSPDNITYKVAFYKPKERCRINTVSYHNKSFSENHYEGEMLEIEYDRFDERYKIVGTDKEYLLPKSAEKFASEYFAVPVEVGENCESLVFYK